jgi:rRNA processing protein Gar1
VPDPVAWKVMETGWRVLDADGNEVGKVAEVRGDIEADIFDGITVKRGILGKAEYVSGDAIAGIFEGEVVLGESAPTP